MASAGGGANPATLRREAWTPGESDLLVEWGRLTAAAQHAHYLLATRLRRRNLWLGVPTVVCSAIVGTSLFATLNDPAKNVAVPLRVAVGLLSVLAAVLAATQTFLRFAERSERHVQAGDWYASIKREVDELVALPPERRGPPKQVLDGLRKEMNKAGQTYPEIGEKTWHMVARAYGVEQPGFALESRS